MARCTDAGYFLLGKRLSAFHCKVQSKQSVKASSTKHSVPLKKVDQNMAKTNSLIKANSPESNFYSWWLFNLIPFGTNCAGPVLDHVRQIYRGEIEKMFQTTKIPIWANSQATCFLQNWWLPLQSRNHLALAQSLSWAQRHEPSASVKRHVPFLGRRAVKLIQTVVEEEKNILQHYLRLC